ncbi:MAG: hypothetical protein IPP15_16045 [Saprospiraceae bacterium]|uniref:Uncharacterized protein n=1 Tax=Candidatus Opimibacter skivensis TaxID=2982028 RepID=A0A9D7SZX3_9BACT|nr:hypothetical protein [Candidatus Opimibacter skivensis]
MVQFAAAVPIAISAASAIGASAVKSWKGLDPKTKKIAFWTLAGTSVIVGGRVAYRAIQKANLLKKADNEEAQQAIAFIQGLDPYGMFGLGTDEKLLMNTATEVKNWPEVIKNYKILTGGDLLLDLKGDLSIKDFNSLKDAINTSKDAQKGIVKNEGGQALETGGGAINWGYNDAPNLKDKVFISNQEFYAFPDPSKVSGVSSAYSVLKAPVGKTVGFGTGRLYKGKLSDGAPYVMIELGFKGGQTGKVYKFWVSFIRMKQMDAPNFGLYPLIDASYISSKW